MTLVCSVCYDTCMRSIITLTPYITTIGLDGETDDAVSVFRSLTVKLNYHWRRGFDGVEAIGSKAAHAVADIISDGNRIFDWEMGSPLIDADTSWRDLHHEPVAAAYATSTGRVVLRIHVHRPWETPDTHPVFGHGKGAEAAASTAPRRVS